MEAFLTEWGTEIILSLVITMLGYYLKQMAKDKREQEKHYEDLIQGEEDRKVDKKIEVHLEPVYKELEDIRKRLLSISDKEDKDLIRVDKNFDLIIASYKYRLVELCKQYLNQGYMTQSQYDNLNEFYTLYKNLGGNGQAKSYYEKVCEQLKTVPDSSV